MRVTRKGQVTIPLAIREMLGIGPESEVDFVKRGKSIVLVKRARRRGDRGAFRKFRGIATVKMSTDEILRLTRG